jgi:hypothetical protein
MTMIHTLRSHWDSLRINGELPLRADIDPRQIPDVLDSLFIFERLNPLDVRVRIAGLTLCEMMGMEVRGQSPMSFFDQNARQRFAAVVADVMERPTIARLGLDTVDIMGNEARAEMIQLPLRSDFGDVSRIIGCVTGPAEGFTAPMRFHIRNVDMEALNSTASQNTHSFGFAEQGAGFIMDGTSSFRAISGGGSARPKRPVQAPNYLKLVD